MNTPSHAIVNYALLSGFAPQQGWAIGLGAVLPDLPMLVLVVWARVHQIPAEKVWSEVYWQPFWQDFTHGFHSIPIALGMAIAGHCLRVAWLKYLGLSLVLHSLGDLPLHHDDAHRHFLPLSQYRLISPVSYWDDRHYAVWGALAENLVVLGATVWLFPALSSWLVRGGMGGWCGLLGVAYAMRFWR